jgi:hypothetical protein
VTCDTYLQIRVGFLLPVLQDDGPVHSKAPSHAANLLPKLPPVPSLVLLREEGHEVPVDEAGCNVPGSSRAHDKLIPLDQYDGLRRPLLPQN